MTYQSKEILTWLATKRIHDKQIEIRKQIKGKENVINHPEYFNNPSDQIIWHNKNINKLQSDIEELKNAINDLGKLFNTQNI